MEISPNMYQMNVCMYVCTHTVVRFGAFLIKFVYEQICMDICK